MTIVSYIRRERIVRMRYFWREKYRLPRVGLAGYWRGKIVYIFFAQIQ